MGQAVDEDMVNGEPVTSGGAGAEDGPAEGDAGTGRRGGALDDEAAINGRPEIERPDPSDTEEVIPGGVIGGETASPGAGDATGPDSEVFPGDAPASQGGGAGN